MRLIKAFFRSFVLTLFYTVVCSAIVTVITIPSVGRLIAVPICDGTVESKTSQWSQANGEFGATVDYVCTPSHGESYSISIFEMIKQVAIYYVGFMLVVVWPLIFIINYIRSGRQNNHSRMIFISTFY